MISINSSPSFVFDFTTQNEYPQEVIKGPSIVDLKGKFILVPYGINLPHNVAQNAVGAWINSFYRATDHSTYTIKQNVRFKCSGTLTKTTSASSVKCFVRILKNNVPTGYQKVIDFGTISSQSVTIDFYLPEPISVTIDSVRFENQATYTAQIKFEEWTGNIKLGATSWVTSGHSVMVYLNTPLPSSGVSQSNVIYTSEHSVAFKFFSLNTAEIGVRTDLVFQTGTVGDEFSSNGNDLLMANKANNYFTFNINSNVDKKMRIAVAAKNGFGSVTTVPVVKDICFDFIAPSIKWLPHVMGVGNITLKVEARDTGSGLDIGKCKFKNVTSGGEKPVVSLGNNQFSAVLVAVEGKNTYRFTAVDRAGNVRIIDKEVIVDTASPVISCETVLGNNSSNQTVVMPFVEGMNLYDSNARFKFAVHDEGTGVASVIVAHSGVEHPYSYGGQGDIVCELDLELVEANNEIKVTAKDVSGNESVLTIHVLYTPYNDGGPNITISSPSFNSWHNNSNVVVQGGVIDEQGVDNVRVDASLVNGGSPYTSSQASIVGQSWTAHMSNLVDGDVYLTIIATDTKGVSNSLKHKIRVDTKSPVITNVNNLPSISNQSSIEVKTYAVSQTSDLVRYLLKASNVVLVDTALTCGKSNESAPRSDVVQLDHIDNLIEVTYFNEAGNNAVFSKTIRKINTDIHVSISPTEGSVIPALPFNFSVAVSCQQVMQRISVDYIPHKTADEARLGSVGFYRVIDDFISLVSWYHNFSLFKGSPVIGATGSLGTTIAASDIPANNATIKVTIEQGGNVDKQFFGFTMIPDYQKTIVTNIIPADNSSSVSPLISISVEFSRAIDTASFESNVVISPVVVGNWSWSNGNTKATFSHTQDFSGTVGKITVPEIIKDVNNKNLETTYYSNFTILQQPVVVPPTPTPINYNVEFMPTDSVLPIDVEIGVQFSAIMDVESLSEVIVRDAVTMVEQSIDYHTSVQNNKMSMVIHFTNELSYDTNYEVIVPSTVKASNGDFISEHRHYFRTEEAPTPQLKQGATVTYLKGLNGVFVPMKVDSITTEGKLRDYLNGQLEQGNVGAIFRYDKSLHKWVVNMSGNGATLEFGEAVIVSMNIIDKQDVRFVGPEITAGRNIYIKYGLNCIGLPRKLTELVTLKDVASNIATQIGVDKLVVYLFRRKQGSVTKKAVGYAYRQPITHNGIYLDTADEKIIGDAIIFYSPKNSVLTFQGISWEN